MESSRRHQSIAPLNTERGHKRFIKTAWPQLAAIAWEHYQHEGRGFVLLLLAEAFVVAKDTARTEAQYVAEGSLKFEDMREQLGAETIAAIARYNPEREVVFGIRLPNKSFLVYVVTFAGVPGFMNPPEAFLARALTPPVDASRN